MSLTVETGTGGDALISLAYMKDYCGDVGYDITAFTDDVAIEQAIRRASTYISTCYKYKGLVVGGRDQRQSWPRSNVFTNEGWPVDYLTIPREVQMATAEAAWYELNNVGGLNPSIVLTDRVTHEQVGPLSVSYQPVSSTDLSASRPILTIITDLLSDLVDNYSVSGLTARADRG